MNRLFIFNPFTDFARADARINFVPNKRIQALAYEGMLTQLPLARKGDIFLVPFPGVLPVSDVLEKAADAGCKVVGWDELRRLPFAEIEIDPWGWDSSLRRMLIKHGVPVSSLPTDVEIKTISKLSHRRTTIAIHQRLKAAGFHSDIPLPLELKSADEVRQTLMLWPEVYFKAPWSSSGRGIWPSANARPEETLQWADGIINRYGSVMAEKGFSKKLDFASEWVISRSKACFVGYSLFNTSGRAVYKGNSIMPQSDVKNRLRNEINDDLSLVSEVQRQILDELISPFYSGRAGIDMLATVDGSVNACLELNLRTTMGHIAIASAGE